MSEDGKIFEAFESAKKCLKFYDEIDGQTTERMDIG